MTRTYLDWNATTPPHPDVLAAMRDAAAVAWGNPSSVHAVGRVAQGVLERGREQVARLAGASPRDVVFTSGGTEANNLALLRPFLGPDGAIAPGLLVTSRLEHPSVVAVAESLARRGVRVAWLPVAESGRLDPDDVRRALAEAGGGARLVAMQAVNHETGVVQPVADVALVAREAGADLHVDAVQAAGKLDAALWSGGDTVALAAHKLRGPKGIGALATRPGVAVRPLLRGGAQERGLRPGTTDAVAAAGFGAAARRALDAPARWSALAPLRDRFERALEELGARLGASPARNGAEPRAPHVSNLSWPGWSSDELAAALDLEGLCVSAGSACSAGTAEPSPVIAAMVGRDRARGAIRASLGDETGPEDVSRGIAAYERVLGRARHGR